jgi:hypothetical protein
MKNQDIKNKILKTNLPAVEQAGKKVNLLSLIKKNRVDVTSH